MGLARLYTVKPRFVKEGDLIAQLSEEQQEAERARREAVRRAEKAEQALKERGLGGASPKMSFGRRVFDNIKSFSRMVSMRRSSSVKSGKWGSQEIVSTPVTPEEDRKRSIHVQAMATKVREPIVSKMAYMNSGPALPRLCMLHSFAFSFRNGHLMPKF